MKQSVLRFLYTRVKKTSLNKEKAERKACKERFASAFRLGIEMKKA